MSSRRPPQIVFSPRHENRTLMPGDDLDWDVRLTHITPDRIRAVEVSVLWRTEGKGDEELSVHHFERHVALAKDEEWLLGPYRGTTVLPDAPLSYYGKIMRVVWAVRARLFFDRGREMVADQAFRLGEVREPTMVAEPKVRETSAVDALEIEGEM